VSGSAHATARVIMFCGDSNTVGSVRASLRVVGVLVVAEGGDLEVAAGACGCAAVVAEHAGQVVVASPGERHAVVACRWLPLRSRCCRSRWRCCYCRCLQWRSPGCRRRRRDHWCPRPSRSLRLPIPTAKLGRGAGAAVAVADAVDRRAGRVGRARTMRRPQHPSGCGPGMLRPFGPSGDLSRGQRPFRMCGHRRNIGDGFHVGPIVICTGGCIVNTKKIMAAAAIAAAIPITALGLSSGTANAVPTSPVAPPTTWSQDDGGWWWPGPGHGHGHGWGHRWGPGWGWGPGVGACVSATGPWGYVTGTACI
jgi:hypothetical protein